MEEIVGWIAPVATTIAACMTAANLGARVTGWGFVVFTVGSLAWTTDAVLTGQSNLLWQNVFLTIINGIGIWRWLGREVRFEEGAQVATERSEARSDVDLFPASRLTGGAISGPDGRDLAHAVDAMIERDSGRISYVAVREGGVAGIGERLHALPWADIAPTEAGLSTALKPDQLAGLDEIDMEKWPGARPDPA